MMGVSSSRDLDPIVKLSILASSVEASKNHGGASFFSQSLCPVWATVNVTYDDACLVT